MSGLSTSGETKMRSLDRGQSSSIVVDETSPAESKRTRLAGYQSVDAPQITMREVQLTKEVARLQGLLQKRWRGGEMPWAAREDDKNEG
jgi:hypothetical protein